VTELLLLFVDELVAAVVSQVYLRIKCLPLNDVFECRVWVSDVFFIFL